MPIMLIMDICWSMALWVADRKQHSVIDIFCWFIRPGIQSSKLLGSEGTLACPWFLWFPQTADACGPWGHFNIKPLGWKRDLVETSIKECRIDWYKYIAFHSILVRTYNSALRFNYFLFQNIGKWMECQDWILKISMLKGDCITVEEMCDLA